MTDQTIRSILVHDQAADITIPTGAGIVAVGALWALA